MKTFLTLSLFLGILSCSLTSSQIKRSDKVEGSGIIKKESRKIGSFTKLDASTAVRIILTQGKATPLTVEADDNILPYIETKIIGNTLHVGIAQGYSVQPKLPMNVYISAPQISSFDVSSAASITGTNTWKTDQLKIELSSAASVNLDLKVSQLDIDISSAASANLSGKCQQLAAEVSSAASLNADQLEIKNARLDISSAAHALVFVTDNISYEVSSAASLKYKGNANVEANSEASKGCRIQHIQ